MNELTYVQLCFVYFFHHNFFFLLKTHTVGEAEMHQNQIIKSLLIVFSMCAFGIGFEMTQKE